MRQAVRWQILARNPVDAVDPPKVERSAMRTYDLAQTVDLIDATRGTRMTITVILAVFAGYAAARSRLCAGATSISTRPNLR